MFGRFSRHGLVRFWAFLLSRSGPLMGVSTVTVWSVFGRFDCHWSVMGVLGVTVWSAFRRFGCHSLVPACWAFQRSPSGLLLGVLAVTVWSAFRPFSCLGLVRFWALSNCSCHGLVRVWAF